VRLATGGMKLSFGEQLEKGMGMSDNDTEEKYR